MGNFDGGGGFYWMPTTGAIFAGGLFATDVSADGRTIVGTALDARSATDLPPETKFSWGFGGSVEYFPWEGLGFRGHFRYKPTMLNDEDAGDYCDPFGFCQGTLQRIEIAAGGAVRF